MSYTSDISRLKNDLKLLIQNYDIILFDESNNTIISVNDRINYNNFYIHYYRRQAYDNLAQRGEYLKGAKLVLER